ncbi:hypothetical protein [Deefgea sp. CFH1-16]|uniref:hypothetical protein n=1 Tax=Deefgea sp. CFH1-16 TaxID=2675457 RepID=UPI0015F56461|nr:hypothetical protein [Deefgea sp. CFH1-16]MBM5574646.1 hypothetical protein [Deefgea sp. CFH1-16]
MLQKKIFQRRDAETQGESKGGEHLCIVSMIPDEISIHLFLRASVPLRRILSILFASAVRHG